MQGREKIADVELARSDIRVYEMISEFMKSSSIKVYQQAIEGKDERVAEFPNWEDPGRNFRFRVLEQGDPRHFTVGSETDCCQIIGGLGEGAAVDSFVNKWAGVLLLELMIDGEWSLVYQSYFHYVPKDKGYILDNIEGNKIHYDKVPELTGYSAEEIYALWAQRLKELDPEIEYVLLGKNYTEINTGKFSDTVLEKDPRTFSNSLEEMDLEPYSDWSERGSANLLSKFVGTTSPEEIATTELSAPDNWDQSGMFEDVAGIESVDQTMLSTGLGDVEVERHVYVPTKRHLIKFDRFTDDLKNYLVAFAKDVGLDTRGWGKKPLSWIEKQLFYKKNSWFNTAMRKIGRTNAYLRNIYRNDNLAEKRFVK